MCENDETRRAGRRERASDFVLTRNVSEDSLGPVQQQVADAARWLASLSLDDRPHPIVPALRERFGLSSKEACEAIREATLQHGRAT